MNKFATVQFVLAFAAMGVALFVLFLMVTGVFSFERFSRLDYRAVGGALFVIGGTLAWLLGKLRGYLVNRLGRVSYTVSASGSEVSFRNRKRADMMIEQLRSKGTRADSIRLRKVITNIDSSGSVTMHSEDVPLDVNP